MEADATPLIPRAFEDLPDPRSTNHRHKLLDILTIAILAVISSADGWVEVAHYAHCKKEWLKTFLELPAGIPSHDTFDRVFSLLDPAAFERCFMAWIASLVQLGEGKLIAIDGKSLRRSFEKGWDKSGMAHMVSAFIQNNHMVFGQVKTDGKGQELDGIQKLLAVLDLKGSVVMPWAARKTSPNRSSQAAAITSYRSKTISPSCTPRCRYFSKKRSWRTSRGSATITIKALMAVMAASRRGGCG